MAKKMSEAAINGVKWYMERVKGPGHITRPSSYSPQKRPGSAAEELADIRNRFGDGVVAVPKGKGGGIGRPESYSPSTGKETRMTDAQFSAMRRKESNEAWRARKRAERGISMKKGGR